MLLFQNYGGIRAKIRFDLLSEKSGVTDALAYPSDDTLTVTVRVPRVFCAERAMLRLYCDSDMTESELPADFVGFGDDCDVFAVTLKLSELSKRGSLFYRSFALETPYGRLHVNCDGSTVNDPRQVDAAQLTLYSPDFTTPDRFKGGIMYQIFPDRFARSERAGKAPTDRRLNPDWENGIPQYAEIPGGEVANDEFFGGDLYGIAERLDYIKSLGVDTLYLCPIFRAASNHRYDTGDYLEVDPLLGGDEALDLLIARAKELGMKLILDGVFNHTGADSRYFNKFGSYPGAGAYNSKHSRYYRWYSFDDYPEKYRCWWGVKILPAVKSDEPSYREFICGENGVVRHWLKRGIDGWRLDVADELSDVFLDELRSAAKSQTPDSLILGEVWEDASNKVAYDRRRRYFTGTQLDSVMNYPLKEGVIDFILSGDSTRLVKIADTISRHYPRCVSDVLMNLLGTHDTERILTVLADAGTAQMTNGELSRYRLPADRRRLAIQRLRLAWALICAFPGIPCIYYGDEAGMEGGRDPFNRMPFVPERGDAGLTAFYRRLGAVRRSEPVFAKGGLRFIDSGSRGQLILVREWEGEAVAVCANLTADSWSVEFDSAPTRLLGGGGGSTIRIVEPMSVEYFKL